MFNFLKIVQKILHSFDEKLTLFVSKMLNFLDFLTVRSN